MYQTDTIDPGKTMAATYPVAKAGIGYNHDSDGRAWEKAGETAIG